MSFAKLKDMKTLGFLILFLVPSLGMAKDSQIPPLEVELDLSVTPENLADLELLTEVYQVLLRKRLEETRLPEPFQKEGEDWKTPVHDLMLFPSAKTGEATDGSFQANCYSLPQGEQKEETVDVRKWVTGETVRTFQEVGTSPTRLKVQVSSLQGVNPDRFEDIDFAQYAPKNSTGLRFRLGGMDIIPLSIRFSDEPDDPGSAKGLQFSIPIR